MTCSTATRVPRALLLALLLLGLVVAGCGLPTDGELSRGLSVQDAPRQHPQAIPQPPPDTGGPDDFVRAFLGENSSFQDNPDSVREYLVIDQRGVWDPRGPVLVYDSSSISLETTGTGPEATVTVTVEVLADVDQDGHLTERAPGSTQQATFGLRQVGGQWRIAALPEGFGVWLSRPEFDREFSETPIYFTAPGRDVLVPDVRWFPTSDTMASTVAAALLEPAPTFLRGAVATGIPPDTSLAGDSVPVVDGIAQVDLRGGTVQSVDAENRRRMWAQFTATLGSLGAIDVNGVVLTAQTRELSVPDLDTPVRSAAQAGFADADDLAPQVALLRLDDELRWIDPYDATLTEVDPPADPPSALPAVDTQWIDLAANTSLTRFAAVSEDRTSARVWRGDVAVDLTALRPEVESLTGPSFDPDDRVWVAGRLQDRSRVWAVSPRGGDVGPQEESYSLLEVDVPWLADQVEIRALRISPDGQRALVHLRDTTTDLDQVGVAGIVRSSAGAPTSLAQPVLLAPGIGEVTSVTWVDQTRVGLLARSRGEGQEEESPQPYVATVGGWTTAQGTVERAEQIVGVPGGREERPFVVLNSGGFVSAPEPPRGYRLIRSSTDLVIPGA